MVLRQFPPYRKIKIYDLGLLNPGMTSGGTSLIRQQNHSLALRQLRTAGRQIYTE